MEKRGSERKKKLLKLTVVDAEQASGSINYECDVFERQGELCTRAVTLAPVYPSTFQPL